MLPPMTTPANPRIDDLLSTRARIGWGASAPPARPVAEALFEFGGGHPDPSSFPYEGLVEATAHVMKAEGAPALSSRAPQGANGPRPARGQPRGRPALHPPVAEAVLECGGVHPAPSSFPWGGLVGATADVMKAEGAPALSYGEPQGYKGLRLAVGQRRGALGLHHVGRGLDQALVGKGGGIG